MTPFEVFCTQAHPVLVSALEHHFGDRHLAEDLAQEALVRAGAKWHRVGRYASPVGWAYRVGCNLGVSVLRRRGAERRALERRGLDRGEHLDPDTADRIAVRRALDTLTEAQRRAVVARFYLGLTPEEAADALGTSAGSVSSNTHRGLLRLREHLSIGLDDAAEGSSLGLRTRSGQVVTEGGADVR